jgi:hypothetical protein
LRGGFRCGYQACKPDEEIPMHFDSNRAWREATALAGANREVLLAVAGVFFLLPGFASVLFLSDFQAEMMANFGNPAAAERIMEGMTGPVVAFGLVSFLLQSLGYLAMMALLTDRARPTVSEALRSAIRALPIVIGAALLFFAANLMAVLVVTMLAAALGTVPGLGALAGILLLAMLVGMVYVMIKLSLVVAADQRQQPATVCFLPAAHHRLFRHRHGHRHGLDGTGCADRRPGQGSDAGWRAGLRHRRRGSERSAHRHPRGNPPPAGRAFGSFDWRDIRLACTRSAPATGRTCTSR